jgi:hypothetical protein
MGKRKFHYYTFCYTAIGKGHTGKAEKKTIALPDVRSLAKYLNRHKRKNPNHQIMVAFLSEANGKFIKVVKFLTIEYQAQQWLVGYKERLLAYALESGYELKWHHGLKPRVVRNNV